MIDYLRGTVTRIEQDYIVVEVNGIGYRVFCANPYAFRENEQRETVVYVHHYVRDDAVQLFGFASREEQAVFRLLLEVSGIGPRIALGVLSGGRPESLVAAIQREDLSYLTRLPGIGKKTAQRMLLELKDKLKDAGWAGFSAGWRGDGRTAAQAESGRSAAWQEAREALCALGFTEGEIAAALPAAQQEAGEDAGAEALMKAALKRLYRA